jgi:hypothetical protein
MKLSSDCHNAYAERIAVIDLQITENERLLERFISEHGDGYEVEKLLVLNRRARECSEDKGWPIRYIEELLASLGEKIEELEVSPESQVSRLRREICDHTRRRSLSTLPPSA